MKRVFVLGAVLFFCVAVGGAREFPLCMYSVDAPNHIQDLKEAGFTCLQSYHKNPEKLVPILKQAQKYGLKVVFYPNEIIGSSYEKEAREKWPVLAWYLVDEPDVHKWSREQVQTAHAKAKKAFPQVPTALVIGQGKTKTPFYDLPDIMMMDWYPVPHLPLTSFGDNVRYTREGMQKMGVSENPMWGVVQIFDWKQYPQFRPDNDRIGRFPTAEEIRFMAYHGILNGADGLFFFPFHHKGTPLPQVPEYWQRVTVVSKELAALRPVFENGKLIANAAEVAEPLQMQTRKYRFKKYAILANTSDKEQPLPAALKASKYKLLYGGESTKKSDKIPPYGVWVLKY